MTADKQTEKLAISEKFGFLIANKCNGSRENSNVVVAVEDLLGQVPLILV